MPALLACQRRLTRGQARERRVVVAVVDQLVSLVHDPAQQLRIFLCPAARHPEARFDAVCRQRVQDHRRVAGIRTGVERERYPPPARVADAQHLRGPARRRCGDGGGGRRRCRRRCRRRRLGHGYDQHLSHLNLVRVLDPVRLDYRLNRRPVSLRDRKQRIPGRYRVLDPARVRRSGRSRRRSAGGRHRNGWRGRQSRRRCQSRRRRRGDGRRSGLIGGSGVVAAGIESHRYDNSDERDQQRTGIFNHAIVERATVRKEARLPYRSRGSNLFTPGIPNPGPSPPPLPAPSTAPAAATPISR